jgi:type IV secretory pathway VirB10-like protein
MKWKKSIFVVMLAGMMVLAMVGCGQAEEPAPAAEQPSPAVEQPAPNPGSTMPLPPEGTMPAPPEGIAPGEGPPAPTMDLATTAAKLGVTEQQLSEALGDMEQGPPDIAAAATKLGISEDSLREALGFPEGGPPTGGPPPDGPPPAGPEPTGQGQ